MMKAMGSNKIGKTCSTKIESTITKNKGNASVQVKYWKTHCGHAQEIVRCEKFEKSPRIMSLLKSAYY